ncbi:MAG: hypothetical protein JRI23_32895 [Deltaproteobacteria bacterium]|nr:hypothetical protein [Deltaproteobacteria bacterium]MBW2537051.1 hypothetical protein [Deltaproteobacteria bacterium]
MPSRNRFAAVTLLVAVVLVAAHSSAAPVENKRGLANSLFQHGRELMREGRHADACRALEESNQLAPGAGIQYNLAECFERIGRIATSRRLFLEVAEHMKNLGEKKREAVARKRAAALEPRMTWMRLDVPSPAPRQRITRNGKVVPRRFWGAKVPVDPGTYRIAAGAPDHASWVLDTWVSGEGQSLTVEVPALQLGSGAENQSWLEPTARDFADQGLGPQTITGIVVGGAGLVALGVTLGLTVHAATTAEEAEDLCDESFCSPEGKELNDEAKAFADAATITLVTGAVLAAAGVVLVLTAPADEEPAEPLARVVVGPGGGSLRLTW